MEERAYRYWLVNIKGIGNKRIETLLQSAESAKNIFEMKKKELQSLAGIGEKLAQSIVESTRSWRVEQEYGKLEKKGVTMILPGEEAYPKAFSQLYDPPQAIFLKGRLPEEKKVAVAIVGARMCSEYGRAMAHEFGAYLGRRGIQVISGMAFGIDGIAQRGALENGGYSLGVLACDVNICYPREHRELYQQLISQGGLLSEYPLGVGPVQGQFPARNRLLSALSDLILVVEAKEKSGSLITADMALEQGKEVFAVPGRITDRLSHGCNWLIKQGAGVVVSPEDLVKELEEIGSRKLKIVSNSNIFLAREEKLLYACLDLTPKSLEILMLESGIPIPKITSTLFALQQKGMIQEIGKNYFRKISNEKAIGN